MKFFFHFSRDEVKTKWGVSDFIKAFIKFHGHVYLSKSLEKLSPLREKLEEQFKVRFQKQKMFYLNQEVQDLEDATRISFLCHYCELLVKLEAYRILTNSIPSV